MKPWIALFLLLCCAPAYAAESGLAAELAKDAPGAKDSSLIGRFEGARILGQQIKEFDELVIPTAPEKDGAFAASEKPRGKVTRTLYVAPAERSTLEVSQTYAEALKAQGFSLVFQCGGEQCGDGFGKRIYGSAERLIANAAYGQPPAPRASLVRGALEYVRDIRYFSARKTGDARDSWVSVYAAVQTGGSYGDVSTALSGSTQALIEIVEPKPSTAKLVTVPAEEIGKGLEASGKVAFYGVYFDFDKTSLTPDSAPQLDEMAKFLQSRPELKVYIVGHTDSKGRLDYNLKLSEGRAASVRDVLAKEYKIDGSRLAAKGLASLAPVASNASEEGRARNRRVELVEQ